MNKLFIFILGGIAGLVLGVIGAFVQADRTVISNRTIPFGFVLAILFIALTQIWLGRAFQSRLAPIGVVVGWAIVTIVLAGLNERGTAIITAAWYSKVYVFGGAVIFGMVSAFPVLQLPPKPHSLEESFTENLQ